MRSWSWQQWLLLVLGVVVAGAVIVAFLLGVTTAVTAGRDVELSGGTLAWLSALGSVALVAAALAVALLLAWVGTKGVEARLARKDSSYLQFVGVSVSVLTWAMGSVVTDDKLVAGLLAAIAGVIGVGAASAIKRWPLVGITLYAALPLGAIVGADLLGAVDVLAWLGERDVRDWALLAALAAIVILVPTSVCLVERHWQTEQWMVGDRFEAWLRRHRALAWLVPTSD